MLWEKGGLGALVSAGPLLLLGRLPKVIFPFWTPGDREMAETACFGPSFSKFKCCKLFYEYLNGANLRSRGNLYLRFWHKRWSWIKRWLSWAETSFAGCLPTHQNLLQTTWVVLPAAKEGLGKSTLKKILWWSLYVFHLARERHCKEKM